MKNNNNNNNGTKDNNYGNNNLSNLTKILQQHPLPLLDHHNTTAVQPQDNMPKITAGPSNAVAADEGLKTEHSRLLDNSSRHNNYENKSTSAVEDVIISIEDNCRFPRSGINACCPSSFHKSLIKDGWIFDFQKNQTTIPEFYSDFDFELIDWEAIGETIPTMLTLVYFTILSVNINISKLEVSLDDHQINTDRELIIQGVSNLIAGTFQVSLRYEESILLIKSGVNNRVVGLILAFCIGMTVYFGQLLLLIKCIPTIAVSTIIFYLGLDMMQEALLDSWKIFNKLEYLNIIATMGAMTFIGFVEGIYIGIAISYISFMLSNYQKGVIRTTFSGNSDRSSVRRHYRDHKFLEKLGSQIYGMTLQGYIFYGAIKGVEDSIKKVLIDCEQDGKPIKFLILNMFCVTGFDINSVHALESIQKHLQHQKVYLVICGISYESLGVCIPLKNLSFWNDVTNDYVKFCDEPNEALEWCENLLLGTYYAKHRPLFSDNQLVGVQHHTTSSLLNDETFCSRQVEDAGKSIFETFKEITNEKEEFFNLLVPYFKKEEVQKDSQLWSKGDNPHCIY
ncbi:7306_t:CDS:2, partial [Entrophospora sp. SA101]